MNLGHHANFPLTYIMPSSEKKKKLCSKRSIYRDKKESKTEYKSPFSCSIILLSKKKVPTEKNCFKIAKRRLRRYYKNNQTMSKGKTDPLHKIMM